MSRLWKPCFQYKNHSTRLMGILEYLQSGPLGKLRVVGLPEQSRKNGNAQQLRVVT